jgi:hypothetical protein
MKKGRGKRRRKVMPIRNPGDEGHLLQTQFPQREVFNNPLQAA